MYQSKENISVPDAQRNGTLTGKESASSWAMQPAVKGNKGSGDGLILLASDKLT